MGTMSWSVNVQVRGAPPIKATSADQPVEAMDRVEVTVEPGDVDKIVDLQPGSAEAIQLILIRSSRYDPKLKLSFKASGGSDGTKPITLDAPLVFSNGSLALLDLAPHQLKLTNETDQPADVEIFVARDATPEP